MDRRIEKVLEARKHLTEAAYHLRAAHEALREAPAREAELAVGYLLPWVKNAREKARAAMKETPEDR